MISNKISQFESPINVESEENNQELLKNLLFRDIRYEKHVMNEGNVENEFTDRNVLNIPKVQENVFSKILNDCNNDKIYDDTTEKQYQRFIPVTEKKQCDNPSSDDDNNIDEMLKNIKAEIDLFNKQIVKINALTRAAWAFLAQPAVALNDEDNNLLQLSVAKLNAFQDKLNELRQENRNFNFL
jgi:hypothetical protein